MEAMHVSKLDILIHIVSFILFQETTSDGEAAAACTLYQVESPSTHPHHITLKKQIPTRWNSVLSMIQSLVALKKPVTEALKRTGHVNINLEDEEYLALEQLEKFLEVFKDLTDLVSAKDAGLSLIPLIRDDIKNAVVERDDDCDELKQLKSNIAEKLDSRFPSTKEVVLCSLLDPSTKDSVSLSREDKIQMLTCALRDEGCDTFFQTSTSNDPAQGDAKLSKKRRLLEKLKTGSGDSSPSSTCIEEEITRYLLCEATPEECDNPFAFWKKYNASFPQLSLLAKIYLSISCSSVAVESMFSITGLMLNSKRSSLAPWKLNYLTFIHDNYSLFHDLPQ